MDLINGNYLHNEICAFSDDWLIVYDGKYNYMLFCTGHKRVIWRYKRGWLPTNDVNRGTKDIEYYSCFDNAVDNLVKVVSWYDNEAGYSSRLADFVQYIGKKL